MTETLFVCSRCDRYHPAPADSLSQGAALRARLMICPERSSLPIAIRGVECLNGCPRPCNAALRSPGKALIRLFTLALEDAPDVLSLARLYMESGDGRVDSASIPARLRNKISQSVIHIPTPGEEESMRAGIGG